ncbi:MAG: hypothetical protein DI535_24900 [Citrobacter freundii]|nr:MAG: hypothetical protein DI535_24900 [Citrobacter freundii]
MSPHSLFVIVLRIIGILTVKTTLLAIGQTLTTIFVMTQLSRETFFLTNIFPSIVVIVIYILVSWALIFRTSYIVERFKLSNDIAPVLQFKLDVRDSLRIALIVAAAVLLVKELPGFIANLARMFERSPQEMYGTANAHSWTPVFISGTQVVIALLMIGERKRILDMLLDDPINNPTDDPEPPAGAEENKDLFPEQS